MTHSGFSGHRAYQQQSRADVRSEASTVTTEMVGPAACADITDEIARAIALGAKEGQHGEDAAIVVRRVGQAELVEDPADIALDSLLVEVEPLADG